MADNKAAMSLKDQLCMDDSDGNSVQNKNSSSNYPLKFLKIPEVKEQRSFSHLDNGKESKHQSNQIWNKELLAKKSPKTVQKQGSSKNDS